MTAILLDKGLGIANDRELFEKRIFDYWWLINQNSLFATIITSSKLGNGCVVAVLHRLVWCHEEEGSKTIVVATKWKSTACGFTYVSKLFILGSSQLFESYSMNEYLHAKS